MQTQVTFRHMKSRNDLRDEAEEIIKKIEKYTDIVTSAGIEFIADSHNIVEITVHSLGKVLVVKELSDEFSKSLHDAADKMIRQLKKNKEKHSHPKGIDLSSFIF